MARRCANRALSIRGDASVLRTSSLRLLPARHRDGGAGPLAAQCSGPVHRPKSAVPSLRDRRPAAGGPVHARRRDVPAPPGPLQALRPRPSSAAPRGLFRNRSSSSALSSRIQRPSRQSCFVRRVTVCVIAPSRSRPSRKSARLLVPAARSRPGIAASGLSRVDSKSAHQRRRCDRSAPVMRRQRRGDPARASTRRKAGGSIPHSRASLRSPGD